MKIWEKVNNITGNKSKSRNLVPYINAGSKFLLSALPEKFLWTIASETEIFGFDSEGDNQIGEGSSVAYDKVLAVYRLDDGKKRICVESPDKNIHIFDEATSLLTATQMFPKFYKLSGKIYIKPDPDYNNHSASKTYTPLGESSTTLSAGAGDKGVVVYSAPPIIDENTDSWILAEYENIVLFYAASLDHLRLSSVYRDLCKAQIDSVAQRVLSFNVPSLAPLKMSITESLPSFSFNTSLPSGFSITKPLPSSFNLSIPLPTLTPIASSMPSSFGTINEIPQFGESIHILDSSVIADALTKAEALIDGSIVTNNAEELLNDEDSEMVNSLVGVASQELQRAGIAINKEKNKLDSFTANVNQKLNKYQSDVSNYTSKVQKESSRITSELGMIKTEVEKSNVKFQGEVAKYQAEIGKESARVSVDVSIYTAELNKEKSRIDAELSKWQADFGKAVQIHNLQLQRYQAESSKEAQRIGAEVSIFQGNIAKASKDLDVDIQQSSIDIQSGSAYTTKSQQSIQSSGMYYQRAINELSAITGSVAAPEQQQSSQRAEQGAST
tara:strand:+ start:60 stop:1727 length:1668 start_codon:yes stop_codon:yes gene_type:complete